MILDAASEDAVKFDAWNDILPPTRSGGYKTSLRAIRTPFIDHLQQHREEAKQKTEQLREELLEAIEQGRQYELVPGAGQSAGMIGDILPAGDIVRQITEEAEYALKQSSILLT